MSDMMLFGVLGMPYEMAMAREVSRFQFWQRAQEAMERIRTLEAQLADAERRVKFTAERWAVECERERDAAWNEAIEAAVEAVRIALNRRMPPYTAQQFDAVIRALKREPKA
jgi:hypothetical protein